MDALLWLFSLVLLLSQSIKGEVKTGIVPIFSPRSTNQPITFTFTTPSPLGRVATEYPVQVDARSFPTLRPPAPENSWNTNELPEVDIAMPIYNQAQYFRALQKAQQVQTPPRPEVINENFWNDVQSAWDRTKVKLADTGALNDWRRLWEKLTGVLEPFLMEVGEQLGKAVNRAVRYQAAATGTSQNSVKQH